MLYIGNALFNYGKLVLQMIQNGPPICSLPGEEKRKGEVEGG